MKIKLNLFFVLLTGVVFFARPVLAQSNSKTEADDATTVSTALTDTLSNVTLFQVPAAPDEVLKNISLTQGDAEMQNKIANGEIKLATKKYSKVYVANNPDALAIDNRFGEVKINTWDRKEFKVEVQINIYADNLSDAQSFMDVVNITDGKKDALVSFKTMIGNTGTSDRLLWKGDSKSHLKKIEINYLVYMPSKNALSINNNYGTTILPDFDGRLSLNNFCSELKAQKINNPLNEVKVTYGNASIESFSGTRLEIAYGHLQLSDANNLNANISYGEAHIGRLYSSANINIRFGRELSIGSFDKKFKALNINSSYTGLKLGKLNELNASYDVTTSYGVLKLNNPQLNFLGKTNKDNINLSAAKSYKGQAGKSNTTCSIVIKSNFGQVNLD
ncbi:hypothetical protein [Mucilaginibacter celer]|nr:hypothetical protein [Mucilaginibacter celer]